MTFREQLEKALNNNLNILDLTIANEIDNTFCFIDENDFEIVCQKVKEIYLDNEHLSIEAIVSGFYYIYFYEKGNILSVDTKDKDLLDFCYNWEKL